MQPLHLPARDTLNPAPAASPAAQARLDLFAYPPASFGVTTLPLPRGEDPLAPDALVRFPSPKPSGLAPRDEVCLLWFAPAATGRRAPACLVLPTINPDLVHAKTSARLLAERGVHGFIPVFPGAFTRAPDPQKGADIIMLEHGPQAVADTRRAVDAIGALAQVAPAAIGLHAMSLGGLLGIAAAGIDNPFPVLSLVSTGTDPWLVISQGQGAAANFRRRLAEAGHADDGLHRLLAPLDPTPLLGRIRAARCRLMLPEQDEVFPAASQRRLVDGLPPSTQVTWRPGTHATAHAWLPESADQTAADLFRLVSR